MILGSQTGGVGTLNIGTNPLTESAPTAPGIFGSDALFAGLGDGAINFNHSSSNYFFTSDGTASGTPTTIAGSLTVNVLAGTTTLSDASSHSGPVNLLGGTLRIGDNGALAFPSAPLTFDGGTLESIAATTVDRSTTIKPGGATFRTTAVLLHQATISGSGALTKTGTDTLTLSGANTYRGGTTLDHGTLQTTDPAALGTGALTQNNGTLDPVGPLSIRSLDWRGGNIATALGDDLLEVRGKLRLTDVGRFRLTAGTEFDPRAEYLILTARNLARFNPLTDFIANRVESAIPVFRAVGRALLVSFVGPPSGPILQNSAPVNTPITADFTVTGPVRTGAPDESNTVNSLRFSPDSSLTVFNNLTVTSGQLDALSGESLIANGTVVAPNGFQKTGPGSLLATTDFDVTGTASVDAGAFSVNGRFTAPGGLTVTPGSRLGGAGLIAGNVTNRGTVNPGNSPGTLTIDGDFTQTSPGTLQIEIASTSIFDRLVVSGTAALGGTLRSHQARHQTRVRPTDPLSHGQPHHRRLRPHHACRPGQPRSLPQ